MTIYNASKMAAGVQPKVAPSGVIVVVSSLALVAALQANDTINMLQLAGNPDIPTNFGPVITGLALDSDDLDSNGVPTLTFDLGDAGNAARFMNQVTVGQAGGYVGPNVAGTLGYAPFANTYGTYTTQSLQLYTLVLKCHTGPATWQNGTVRVKCEYTYDP